MKNLLPDLSTRSTHREQMDRPDCDVELLRRTIAQYDRINAWFTASRRLIRACLFPTIEADPRREHRWLDIGAGGCDIPLWIAGEARRRGWQVKLVALDHDPRIVTWARERTAGVPEIEVVQGAASDLPSLGDFDVIFSNHLLHHLTDEQAAGLLLHVNRQARLGFLLNDLRRSSAAYLAWGLAARLLFRESLALEDGLLSIRRSFRPGELDRLVRQHVGDLRVRVFTAIPARVCIARYST
jgi:2-polyprenyl-3-methyl-5-hydroxy-6-metoxy-1,4-benzoquinol methylase